MAPRQRASFWKSMTSLLMMTQMLGIMPLCLFSKQIEKNYECERKYEYDNRRYAHYDFDKVAKGIGNAGKGIGAAGLVAAPVWKGAEMVSNWADRRHQEKLTSLKWSGRKGIVEDCLKAVLLLAAGSLVVAFKSWTSSRYSDVKAQQGLNNLLMWLGIGGFILVLVLIGAVLFYYRKKTISDAAISEKKIQAERELAINQINLEQAKEATRKQEEAQKLQLEIQKVNGEEAAKKREHDFNMHKHHTETQIQLVKLSMEMQAPCLSKPVAATGASYALPESHRDKFLWHAWGCQGAVTATASLQEDNCSSEADFSAEWTPIEKGASTQSNGKCINLSENAAGLGKCFLPHAAFKSPDGHVRVACNLNVQDEVVFSDGTAGCVTKIIHHDPDKYSIVELSTSQGTFKFSASHRVETPGSQACRANELKIGDEVLVGSKRRKLTKVNAYRETTQLVEISFEPDKPIETFMMPTYGIQTRGEPSSTHNQHSNADVIMEQMRQVPIEELMRYLPAEYEE